MPKLLSEESFEKDDPVLFFYTTESSYSKVLFQHYQDNFKLLVISSAKPPLSRPFYFLSTSELERLDGIAEKIEYGIFFLTSQQDKINAQKILKTAQKKLSIPLLFLIPIRQVADFIDILLQFTNTPKVSFLLLGDIYSPQYKFENNTSQILNALSINKEFQLAGNDLEPVFPIALEDTLSGIASMLFASRKRSGTYYLFYKHPQSINTLIQLARRVDPEIQVSYKEPNSKILRYTTQDEISQFLYQKLSKKPQYLESSLKGFEKTLSEFFSKKAQLTHPESPPVQILEQKPPVKNVLKKHFKRLTIFWLIFLCILLLITGAFSFYIYIQVQNIQEKLAEGNIKLATEKANSLYQIIYPLNPSIRLGFKIVSIVPSSNRLKEKYSMLYDTVSLAHTINSSVNIGNNIWHGVELPEIKQLGTNAIFAYFQSQRLLSQTNKNADQKLVKTSPYLSLTPLLPKILGYEGQKTYLLLFQNNHELRPTGGFIGSIGTITMLDGKINEFNIEDVYELDGQLTKHVEPHYIIRRFIQPHLYLRDSNFEINFEESAQKAAQIYAIETGKTVDGVVAINYEVLARILAITGPIKLESLNLTFDQNNAFDIIQNEISKDFFPGSTQKKDVLSSLFKKMTEEVKNDPLKTSQIAALFPNVAAEKNILFAFKDPSVQKLISVLGLASDVSDYRILDRKTLKDFLLINEANIGSSKVNRYINREVAYTLDMSSSQAVGEITLTLENKSPKDDYLAYMRFGLPYKSNVTGISINSTDQQISEAITDFKVYENAKFSPPPGIELDNSFIYDRQFFGFVHSIPKGSKETLKISFESGLLPRFTSVMDYSLLYQKQPGTPTYPFTFTLKYPNRYKAEADTITSFGDSSATFSKTISQDEELHITLLEKSSN